MNLTLLDVARVYLGVHEGAGSLDNPLVLHWLSLCAVEDPHDEVPWCSAFINGAVEVFGGRVPRSGSAAARSWLRVGRRVPLVEAAPGWDVVVMTRGAGSQPGVSVLAAPGHVALFVSYSPADGAVRVLGGNQSDSVSFATYPADRVLAVQRIHEE
jgi:uncharacterized protein (TIGR02594 family)